MTRDDVQRQAKEAWLKQGRKGTLELATGTGKTISALHCLYTMPKGDGKVHLFLAETVERKKDVLDDIKKFNLLFGVNVLDDYKLVFRTYQAAYKYSGYEIGLVIADEIHFALSPEYSKFFFNNKIDAVVGLSATIDRDTRYVVDEREYTKGDLIDAIAPVCYTYTLTDAKNDGIGRILNVYVIATPLDDTEKTIAAGSAKKRFYQTEKAAYDYWDKEHKKSWFITDDEMKSMKIRITATKRSNILFNLPSKIKNTLKLLTSIQGKTIVFGNSLDSLLKVTKNTVSSRYSDVENDKIRTDFDNDKIKVIGSFKKLLQGANLRNLDNVIVMSYYSKEKDIIQRLGRMRKNGDKVGSAFILLTLGTQEEVWFTSMMSNLTDFNIIYCESVEDCIKKYNNV